MIANWGLSQSNTKLQGPKAKNAKPWMNTSKKTKVFYTKNKKVLQGSAAKNAKPWHKKDSSQVYVEVKSGNHPNLKGPKAKNFKYGMPPKINKVNSSKIK